MNNHPERTYRPSFRLYHPNSKGMGGAMEMELRPALNRKEGCVMMKLARQKTVGVRSGDNPTYSTFDWENKLCVKLGFNDLCKILQVMRGECETVEEGKGIVHRSKSGATRINFRHLCEPVHGYSLDVSRKGLDDKDAQSAHIFITTAEALGIGLALEQSMVAVCFGVPEAGTENGTESAEATDETETF
ncbi:MAG: hypothetical protein IKP97_03450 [Kiritimatiellae bacterium]|nr:hypothetical protein [Kiritimatiellia bacterium]